MNVYRVEVDGYVNRRVSNLAVDVVAPDAVTASRLGVFEAQELYTGREFGEVTSIKVQLTGEA